MQDPNDKPTLTLDSVASSPAVPAVPSAESALDIRNRAVKALQDLRDSVPDHSGDVSFGGLNGDLDCALAILKPKG